MPRITYAQVLFAAVFFALGVVAGATLNTAIAAPDACGLWQHRPCYVRVVP